MCLRARAERGWQKGVGVALSSLLVGLNLEDWIRRVGQHAEVVALQYGRKRRISETHVTIAHESVAQHSFMYQAPQDDFIELVPVKTWMQFATIASHDLDGH